jgi:hypothetical protein
LSGIFGTGSEVGFIRIVTIFPESNRWDIVIDTDHSGAISDFVFLIFIIITDSRGGNSNLIGSLFTSSDDRL